MTYWSLSTARPVPISPGHYLPRIINAVDNDLFAQCWKDHIYKLVVDSLLVTLPVSWNLDIVRRGFMVHGRDDPSVTPHVLKIGIGREVEITEQKAGEIVDVLAELISSHWSGEVVYVEVCRSDWRSLKTCATASNTPFVSGSTSSQTLPFPESSSSSSIGQMLDKSKSFDETVSTNLQATPEVRPKWWKRMYYRIVKTKTKPTDKSLLNF
ncbi:hypothetical protein BKA61DRAFT_577445 [Leptodontidium sp. MPI-SDFR-AT-0119]|nr:hypothetical protein BKA61DRAFT_577445 [Leptodontidium sp. MPI-SDFR-AT-0119]